MTTLNAIAYTTVGSLVVAFFTFIFFGCAVRATDPKIAPRCTARSPHTIYNPKARKKRGETGSIFSCFKGWGGNKDLVKKDDDCNVVDKEESNPKYVQYRGWPMCGWMFWVMSLKYEDMLKGVPGTGTRKDGMEGSMLKVNLDGIVLLRFHGEFDSQYFSITHHWKER